jgi:hypothetical protein
VQPAVVAAEAAPAPNRLRLAPTGRPGTLEGFVPVELLGLGPRTLGPSEAAPPPAAIIEAADAADSWATRDSLFGDADL